MVVDLAVPATPPTTSASAPDITGSIIDAKEGDNLLELDAGATSPLDKESSAGTAPPVSKDGPENGRTPIDRDADNVNGSDIASSVSASAAGSSPEDMDGNPRLGVNVKPISSSIERSEGQDEAASGADTADEGESVRYDHALTPRILKLLPSPDLCFDHLLRGVERGASRSMAARCIHET